MLYRMISTIFAGVVCVVILSCSDKRRSPDHCLFLVGGDSVSLLMVNRLVPDSLPQEKRFFRAALELACVKANPAKPLTAGGAADRQVKQAGSDLAQQLSRLSSDAWSAEAGTVLYSAAKLLAEKAVSEKSLPRARDFADSLFSSMVVVCDSGILGVVRQKKLSSIPGSSTRPDDPAFLEPLFALLFDLPSSASKILGEFVATAEKEPKQVLNMNSVIKGLVFDSARQKGKKIRSATVENAAIAPDNSKEALRFRGSGSIKDSIKKHIPDLEALYKKHLKMNQTMEGTVWVTFHINPDGSVINAQVKTSAITDRNFLIPFRDYVIQKIRFQRIPDKAGPMSVEFPFEFSPEH
jgi:TonB family protein